MVEKDWTPYLWKRFWYITIVDIIKKRQRNHFVYRCDCWKEKVWWCTDIIKWKIRSCWCMTSSMIDDSWRLTHWMSKDRLYKIYHDAKKRCTNKHAQSYKDYWWRWIKMEWKCFEDFKKDMHDSYIEHCNKYGERNTTIERIDVNWNYCKDNCRWATQSEQCGNKRNTMLFDGKHLKEIAKEVWLSYSCIYYRLVRWKSIYDGRHINKFK